MIAKRLLPLLALQGALTGCSVELPDAPAPKQEQWARQGWTAAERHWFHHAAQGTSTFGLPYEWFAALEQPEFSLYEVGLFADQRYLSRFGFIPSPSSVYDSARPDQGHGKAAGTGPYAGKAWNPQNLPVGFAVGEAQQDTVSGRLWPIPGTGYYTHALGLTCAACHTGQLDYGEHRILIDGGAALISLDKFREALGLSLAYTKFVPGRFDRFARRVLGAAYNEVNRDALKKQYDEFLEAAQAIKKLEDSVSEWGVAEGYGRLDALNRIGNEVFAMQAAIPSNIHPTTGPVSYPFIWSAPWFDWVQYNTSIQQPMVRNVGEAMGVKAPVNLRHPRNKLYSSRIPVTTIHEMEQLLAGDTHPLQARRFGGLQSPRWETLPLPQLDAALVEQGRRLYAGDPEAGRKGLCVGCHLPPIDSPEIFHDRYWKAAGAGYPTRYLALKTKAVIDIGTDCKTAYDMVYRTVVTPDFLGNSGIVVPPFSSGQTPSDCPNPHSKRRGGPKETVTNFGVALGEVVERTKEHWYDTRKLSAEERKRLDGYRPNGIRAVVDGLPHYKARPLNGVWSTAPYLHNGSIPNLYLLLSTQEERDREAARFYLGSREFDPKYLGYRYRTSPGPVLPGAPVLADASGLFELDTHLPGNRNTGHLFTDEEVTGRVGPRLSEAERMALIEYLKSL